MLYTQTFFIASCFPFCLALNKGLTPTSNPPETSHWIASQDHLMGYGPWKKWIVVEITKTHLFLGAGVSRDGLEAVVSSGSLWLQKGRSQDELKSCCHP